MRHVRRHCFLVWRRALRRWRSPPTRHSRSPTGSQTPTLPSPCAKPPVFGLETPSLRHVSSQTRRHRQPVVSYRQAEGSASSSPTLSCRQRHLSITSAAPLASMSRGQVPNLAYLCAKPCIGLTERYTRFVQKVYKV